MKLDGVVAKKYLFTVEFVRDSLANFSLILCQKTKRLQDKLLLTLVNLHLNFLI